LQPQNLQGGGGEEPFPPYAKKKRWMLEKALREGSAWGKHKVVPRLCGKKTHAEKRKKRPITEKKEPCLAASKSNSQEKEKAVRPLEKKNEKGEKKAGPEDVKKKDYCPALGKKIRERSDPTTGREL